MNKYLQRTRKPPMRLSISDLQIHIVSNSCRLVEEGGEQKDEVVEFGPAEK